MNKIFFFFDKFNAIFLSKDTISLYLLSIVIRFVLRLINKLINMPKM